MTKTMTVSLLFVLVLATILFLLVWYLTDDAKAAREAASVALAALPGLSSWLEHLEARHSSDPGKRMAIRSFEGFSISLPLAVAMGTMVGVAIIAIASVFAGVALSAATSQILEGAKGAASLAAANFGNIPIFLVGFYLLGRWVSWRCSRNGTLAVVLTALLTATILRSTDFLLMSPEEWESYYQLKRTSLGLLEAALIEFAAILVPSLLGAWHGRRERMSKYMGYLLSALPEETQNSLVDLAFEEVTNIVEARRSR
jgi:hypothetical protein